MLAFKKLSMIITGTVLITLGTASRAPNAKAATFIGPTPYLSFNDSPFKNLDSSYFHLEDFEDGLLNTPGVNAPYGAAFSMPDLSQDSVDADDGVIDGLGRYGGSFWANTDFIFIFDPVVLGVLPTHAGITWTDAHTSEAIGYGYGWGTFKAFDALGQSLGTSGPTLLGDGNTLGQTSEDRFFGVFHEQGISAIKFSMPNVTHGASIDHLQYGYSDSSNAAVPEPTTIAGLAIAGSGFLAARRQRKQKRVDSKVS
jgi:hypothetical protein